MLPVQMCAIWSPVWGYRMSKSFRGRLLGAIFLAGAARPGWAEAVAAGMALDSDSNPTLHAQRATQRALDESYVQARAGYRPTVSLSAQALYTEDRVPRAASALEHGRFESNSGSASLQINQPVYTGGRVGAAVSA